MVDILFRGFVSLREKADWYITPTYIVFTTSNKMVVFKYRNGRASDGPS